LNVFKEQLTNVNEKPKQHTSPRISVVLGSQAGTRWDTRCEKKPKILMTAAYLACLGYRIYNLLYVVYAFSICCAKTLWR